MKLVLVLVGVLTAGLLSSSLASATSKDVALGIVGDEPQSARQLASLTTISSGQVLSGFVHWTVQASGRAHAVRFYKDEALLGEVVGEGTSWTFVLDTTAFADGVSEFGYEIYDNEGKQVARRKGIQVTINNHAPGAAGSTLTGGSDSPVGASATVTPPAPVIIRIAAKPKLLVGAYAQTVGRRGERFASAMFVIRSDNGRQITRGKVTCHLAASKLVWRGWYRRAASCRWAIRANARLGRRTGWLAVTAKGLTVTRRIKVVIKR
jgi:hypothetical protein